MLHVDRASRRIVAKASASTPRSCGIRVPVVAVALWAIFAATMLLAPNRGRAQEPGSTVIVPLTIDYITLGEALKQQVYTDHGRAPLWNGSDQCQYLYAENPAFSRKDGRVKLETNGTLSLGVAVGSQCLSPITWSGIIEAETVPYIAAHMMLKLHVTDLNLYNPQHEKTLIVGKGFDLIKQYFVPRLETFSFDLNPATRQLENLAEAAAAPEVTERIKAALATLRAEPAIQVLDDGVRAALALTLPALPTASAAPAPAQLTPAELAAFEKLLDQWDAFLVFAIKQLGGTSRDPRFRDDLLSLLLDSRHRLVAALAHPESGGPDPVRLLFVKEWRRLGEIIRSAARRGTLGNRSLEFLSFISAGDALFAFDEAAPALGMRISAEDLRRLAHIMAPQATANPLAFSFDEDPELRAMFGITEPLEIPGPLETPPAETPTPTPGASAAGAPTPTSSASPSAAMTPTPGTSPTGALTPTSSPSPSATIPPTPAPSPSTSPTPTASSPAQQPPPPSGEAPASPAAAETPAATGRAPHATPGSPPPGPSASIPASWGNLIPSLDLSFRVLEPAEAQGAEPVSVKGDAVRELQELGRKLKRVVVDDDNLHEYSAEMGRLLELCGGHEIAAEDIGQQYRVVFMRLVKTTAWQESCWRQFVLKRNRVIYLESSSGDIGLMQVNKYVWRGFYRVPRLEWDVLYNADAGMQILARLFEDIADKSDAASPGRPDELARSVYAAYNGGPGAYRRWRKREPRLTRLIDRMFWAKYQAILHGAQIDLLACAAEWSKQPGH